MPYLHSRLTAAYDASIPCKHRFWFGVPSFLLVHLGSIRYLASTINVRALDAISGS